MVKLASDGSALAAQRLVHWSPSGPTADAFGTTDQTFGSSYSAQYVAGGNNGYCGNTIYLFLGSNLTGGTDDDTMTGYASNIVQQIQATISTLASQGENSSLPTALASVRSLFVRWALPLTFRCKTIS